MQPAEIINQTFDDKNGAKYQEQSLLDDILGTVLPRRSHLNIGYIGAWLVSWFPIIAVLKRYKLSYIPKDVLAGFTIGVLNVPQGLAYGLLAGLDPVYGLYVSLIMPAVYALFTDSHHVSMGTFAIVSLMVNGAIHNVQLAAAESSQCSSNASHVADFWCGMDADTNSGNSQELVQIAVSLTLLVALIQIGLGILHFGFMASYLSVPLVSGLTTGAAIHVGVSQIGYATGVENLPVTGVPLGIIKFCGCFVKKAPSGNWATVAFTAVCVITIYVVKAYIDPKTRPKIKIPIPIDLAVVILATLLTWAFSLDTNYNIGTVGNIPKGLPAPMVPQLKWFPYLFADALSIAVVSYSLNVSLGKLYGKNLGYTVSQNQEWFSIGLAHLVSAFFQCHPGGSSLSRSQVQSSAGGKTQVVSFVSSIMLLVVLVAIAPLFDTLPKGALAATILVALRKLVMQVEQVPQYYRKSKVDAAIWVVCCFSVLILDVSTGLVCGVAFAILTVVFRQQWPSSQQMGEVDGIYKTIDAYDHVHTYPGIMILRLDAPLSFVNVDVFAGMVYKKTGIAPLDEKRRRTKIRRKIEPMQIFSLDANGNGGVGLDNGVTMRQDTLKCIILDCGSVAYIDVMGVDILEDLHKQYKDIDIKVYFANCKLSVRQMLEKCKFYEKVSKKNLFPTVEFAVKAARVEWDSDVSSTRLPVMRL